MQREHRRVLQEVWAQRSKDTILKSPRELVILASIIEKETGRSDERPRVSGVFHNRLERKMRLESDPTIIYGLTDGKGVLNRAITRADIEQVTPYNTYRISGLPPGPIANPGRAALEAAANPSRTSDLFFVADGTGGHAFAETYAQHSRNVDRWRQIEVQRRREEAQGPRPEAQPSRPTNATPGEPETTGRIESVPAPAAPGFEAPLRRASDGQSFAAPAAPAARSGGEALRPLVD
jgi:UPF0755 protein